MATNPPTPRTNHPYYMYDSILQQPSAIARVINEEHGAVNAFADVLASVKDIHIVGIGTSWHGALVGEALLRSVAGRHDARAWNSFEFSSFPPELSKQSAVIVLSHRGTKQFSLKSLEIAKAAGAVTAICTGLNSSAKTEVCDFVFRTSEQEKSSAFTVSHTCAITVLLLVAISLGKLRNTPLSLKLNDQIQSLPDLVRKHALSFEPVVEELVQKTKEKSIFYFVGYGINVSNTYEVALKIKEACYVFTEGFQIEQYVHGPICATDERSAVIFLDPYHSANSDNTGSARTQEIINAALEVGATVCALTASKKDVKSDKYVELELPALEESFTSIIYLVLLQLFTYKLALACGKNPDRFRKDNPVYAAATARYKL